LAGDVSAWDANCTQPEQQVGPAEVLQPTDGGWIPPLQPAESASYSEFHHDYPATDIFAPRGTDFVAVTSGVVDWVTRVDVWDPDINDGATRGGLSVAIIGDDGIRYYGSHMEWVAPDIEVGVRVETGQLLSRVGNTGSAQPTSPHLHFGISRPTTPGDWAIRRGEVNPYQYLNAWKEGTHLTPELPS